MHLDDSIIQCESPYYKRFWVSVMAGA